MEEKLGRYAISRRRFVGASSLAVAACVVSPVILKSRDARAGRNEQTVDARFLRRDVTRPDLPASVIDTYRTAVTAMLRLPPEDPRNWYRQALVHLLDCPHGNWWFLPWHRGYIGWFERICRELGGDPEFALPYWDWTASPRLPSAFFEGVLNPLDELFHEEESFVEAFREPIGAFWKNLTPIQSEQLARREIESLEDFWLYVDILFRPRFDTRRSSLSAESPDLDSEAKRSVSAENIASILGPRQFEFFAGGKAAQHSEDAEKSMLEAGPHDSVHSDIGGFMRTMLSPVDPLFYLHHANVDRLWEAWMALQGEEGQAVLPKDDDFAIWGSERFEFFHDEAGLPVMERNAGSYADIGSFSYAYQPASTIISRPPPVRDDMAGRVFMGTILQNTVSVDQPASAIVSLPPEVIDATVKGRTELKVRVTMQSPSNGLAWNFHLWLPSNDSELEIDEYIGLFYPFGAHGAGKHDHRAQIFSLPLSSAIRRLESAGRLDPDLPLKIRLSTTLTDHEVPGQDSLRVDEIVVAVI
ncbi:MAG TPA: tyrosinase family protein [Luteibacter sp.]|nr:tyrosinase family protein [Luteibacter sp.]